MSIVFLRESEYVPLVKPREEMTKDEIAAVKRMALVALQQAIAEDNNPPENFGLRHIFPTDDFAGVSGSNVKLIGAALNRWIFDTTAANGVGVSANTDDWKILIDVPRVPDKTYIVIYGVRPSSDNIVQLRFRDANSTHGVFYISHLATEYRDPTGYFTRVVVAKPQSRFILEAIVAGENAAERLDLFGFVAKDKNSLEFQGQKSGRSNKPYGL